ncbi:PrgI family protein [Allokutzneria albata]|uniref:PrgI family protein n=1 Tax=Allokutzneria albata TaxID=211114 RepID=A0A1G9Y940_ALLAB|nr:PrgI family protein [Allokutzneria albata]SDN05530.1 PrgI family protein [Allokutzneria albata]
MSSPVRIPADVDRDDRILGPLTARQVLILAGTGLVVYAAWTLLREVVPVAVFGAVAIPIGVTAVVLALGQRDGLSLDRLALAAIRQRLRPRHQVAAPEGVQPAPAWLTAATNGQPTNSEVSPAALRLPAEAVTDTGVIDLGGDGLAVVAVASTVNFALRTVGEQEALVAGFGRYLHSLTAPIQVLVRTQRLDLTGQIGELHARAGALPHPALEAAAREHADYLGQLGEQTELLRRQVLLILREPLANAAPDSLGGPGPLAVLSSLTPRKRRRDRDIEVSAAARRAAEARLERRLSEAVELLAPAGIVLAPLDAGQATAVLASACNPDTFLPASAELAGADDVITTAESSDPDDELTNRNAFDNSQDEDDWDYDDEPNDDDFDDRRRWR